MGRWGGKYCVCFMAQHSQASGAKWVVSSHLGAPCNADLGPNPHNLTFAINRSVCYALKYQELFVQNLFSSLPLEVLMEIVNEWKAIMEFASGPFSSELQGRVGGRAAVKWVVTSSRVNCVGCCWLYEWVYYFLCFWLCLTISNTQLRISFRWWIIKL